MENQMKKLQTAIQTLQLNPKCMKVAIDKEIQQLQKRIQTLPITNDNSDKSSPQHMNIEANKDSDWGEIISLVEYASEDFY